jgi:hypothetical protein
MKRVSAILLAGLLAVVFIQFNTGCANIIPPTGGPKDSLAPVLIIALPKDSTLNFTGNKIVFTFDEYVLLDDKINDELVVSPNPDFMPIVEGKLKNVTVKLKDSLKPNTTYYINFGNAIKDVNEGNKLRHFTYVFSTGKELSSGTISGKVTLAETGETDSTLLVLLYTNLTDSAVKKNKPEFFTHLDSSGHFIFKYLPKDTFAIYVVPNDYSKRYDDSTKIFAFFDTTIDVNNYKDSVQLFAYQQEKAKPKPSVSSSNNNDKKNAKEEDKRLKLSTDIDKNEQGLLTPLSMLLSRKVTVFDSAKIILSDTNYKPLSGYSFIKDTSFKKFSLQYKWPENEPFILVIQKEAFADSAGITLSKNDTIKFVSKRESQYGSVRLHFNNLNLGKNPVLQLMLENKIYQSVILTGADWSAKLFEPGEYELRLLYDDNKNGVWDAGNFDARKQPEKVQRIPRKLTIKPNWDNEVDINL